MTTRKKVVFWGTPEFSLPSLEATFENADLLAVVTQPDRMKGRGHEVQATPVKEWSLRRGLKVFSPQSLRKLDEEGEALLSFLRANAADYFIVVAYGNLLPQNILDLPTIAAVNVHGSLLPRWRGAAPIQRSLEAGDAETGVSLQQMVMQLDAGDVILEKKYPIQFGDNAKTLFNELSKLGGFLIADFLKKDFSSFSPQKQDSARVTVAAKISKEEATWTPGWTSAEMCNRVRAFLMWPTVKIPFAKTSEKLDVKVLEARPATEKFLGDWGSYKGVAFLKCADGYVFIDKAQLPGKGPASGESVFQRLSESGYQLHI